MEYAIIRLGGKQYRVREGEYLVVDRVKTDEGKTFSPEVLLGDGDRHGQGARTRARAEDPHRQVPQAHRLQAPQRLPRRDLAHRDLARRRPEARACEEDRGRRSRAGRGAAPTAAPAEAPAAADDHVKGMPSGYEEMTVAQVSEGAKTWNRPMLEAALAYEQAHAARKGAISALESALKAKEEDV